MALAVLIFSEGFASNLQIYVFSVCKGSIESEKIYCSKILAKMGEEEGFSDDIIYVYQTITSIVYIQSWKTTSFEPTS